MFRLTVFLAVLLSVGQIKATEFFFDADKPYLSADDIPDGFYLGGNPTALEDFEDGVIDFGIIASGGEFGSIHGAEAGHMAVDSVDADDGIIDGSGSDGESWWMGQTLTPTLTFTFSEPLPTAAGLVWTDGGFPDDLGLTTLEAFGPGMDSLGTLGPFLLGDGSSILGETAEDRFLGVQDSGGILAIRLMITYSVRPGGMEVDHVQFGNAVPEPSTIILLLTGALGLLVYRIRRR